jgi:hypothetical protein
MKKIYRTYLIIDIDTGEIYKKVNNKEFETIKNEKTKKYTKDGIIEETRRIVKHNGQQRLFK